MENWADNLIEEYTVGKKELERMKERLDSNNPIDQQDIKAINSMIDDMAFAIDWMKKGRRPGNLHGIDRRSAYQRRVLLDMDLFPSIDLKPQQVYLTEEQKRKLVDVLIILSHRERQCYLLHMAQGMSFSEIADELQLSRSSIQVYVKRAKEKVSEKVLCHAIVG